MAFLRRHVIGKLLLDVLPAALVVVVVVVVVEEEGGEEGRNKKKQDLQRWLRKK